MQSIVNLLAAISPWPTIIGPSLTATLFLTKWHTDNRNEPSFFIKRTTNEINSLNELKVIAEKRRDRRLIEEMNGFIDHLNRSAFHQYLRRYKRSSADAMLYISIALLVATTAAYSTWKITSYRATSQPEAYNEAAFACVVCTIVFFIASVIFLASHYILLVKANKELKIFDNQFIAYRDEFNSRFLPPGKSTDET